MNVNDLPQTDQMGYDVNTALESSDLDAGLESVSTVQHADSLEEISEEDLSADSAELPASNTEDVPGDGEKETSSTDSGNLLLSIDVGNKKHEFKLDPNDENLRRTIRNGVKAAKIKEEAETIKKEHVALKSSLGELQEFKGALEELKVLSESKNYEGIFKEILGESRYEKYIDDLLDRREAYRNASPEEREAMDKEKKYSQISESEMLARKKLKELEDKIASQSDEIATKEFMQFSNSARQEHEFKVSEIADKDLRHRINVRLWGAAQATIQKVSKSRDITPAIVNKIFKHEADLLRNVAGLGKAPEKVSKDVEAVKKTATAKAQSVAKDGLPAKSVDEKVRNWNGKSVKDLIGLMTGRG